MTRISRRRLGRRILEPFPAVAGNSFAAAEHGPSYFGRMLDAIAAARSSVDVQMYLWDDDELGLRYVEALRAAAARGVRVRVLIDAVGSRAIVDRISVVDDAGGDVRLFSPFRIKFLRRYFHRTHKKMIVCDGEAAFTGGAGFSLYWSGGKRREGPWHDRMFEMRGPVLEQLARTFETDFERWPARHARMPPERADAKIELAAAGTAELRVLRGWPNARDFRHELVERIRAARERVWIGTPYFIPPPSLLRALSGARKRGVDVRLVLPSGNHSHPLFWHASRRHYGFLLRRGVTIHEFDHGFYHAKLAVIDRDAAIVGSSNLDYFSWSRNAEMDILVTDRDSVDLVADCFEADRARGRSLSLREMGLSGTWLKMKDRMAGWFARWM